jgi:hypothetical protein
MHELLDEVTHANEDAAAAHASGGSYGGTGVLLQEAIEWEESLLSHASYSGSGSSSGGDGGEGDGITAGAQYHGGLSLHTQELEEPAEAFEVPVPVTDPEDVSHLDHGVDGTAIDPYDSTHGVPFVHDLAEGIEADPNDATNPALNPNPVHIPLANLLHIPGDKGSYQLMDTSTNMPTLHPCDDGSHGCDLSSTYCAVQAVSLRRLLNAGSYDSIVATPGIDGDAGLDATGSYGGNDASYTAESAELFICNCLEGFVTDTESDKSCLGTSTLAPAPTFEPTMSPTIEPTHQPTLPGTHPCDDGTHDCDTISTQCYKTGTSYYCECLDGFHSSVTVANACEAPEGEGESDEGALERENHRLRAELERLKEGSHDAAPADLPHDDSGQHSDHDGQHVQVRLEHDYVMKAAGSGYSVGERVSVGGGVEGWEVPAEMSVTAVDENGGVIGVGLITAGDFNGEQTNKDGSGQYNLDPESASLLLQALTRSKEPSAGAVYSKTIVTAASAAMLAVVVGVLLMKRRAVTRLAGEASTPVQEAAVDDSILSLRPSLAAIATDFL